MRSMPICRANWSIRLPNGCTLWFQKRFYILLNRICSMSSRSRPLILGGPLRTSLDSTINWSRNYESNVLIRKCFFSHKFSHILFLFLLVGEPTVVAKTAPKSRLKRSKRFNEIIKLKWQRLWHCMAAVDSLWTSSDACLILGKCSLSCQINKFRCD